MLEARNKLVSISVCGAQSKIRATTAFVVEDRNELSRKTATEILPSLIYRREPLNIFGMLLRQWWYFALINYIICTFIKWLQIDAQWRFFLTTFSLSYLSSWFIFAVCWYLISYTHGDLNKNLTEQNGFRSCVVGCKSFADFFLFSLETQVLAPTWKTHFVQLMCHSCVRSQSDTVPNT